VHDQKLLDNLIPRSGLHQRLPLVDSVVPVQWHQAIQLSLQRVGVALEVRILVAEQAHADVERNVKPHARRLAHAGEQRVGHAQVADPAAFGFHEDGSGLVEPTQPGPQQ
jgi:hypothetical protein